MYMKDFDQVKALYLTEKANNQTKLIIYDTESEREQVRILDTPKPLNSDACVTQLPNDEIFCFGNSPASGITLIIDKKYAARVLPSGEPCLASSCIYFNSNVYCFGGRNSNNQILALSKRFNLNENQWINLTPMPNVDTDCHSAIFNGNILISRFFNRNLLLYSIDIDSFSILPYEFGERKRKILINADKLYLIECWNGLIYESDNEYNWEKIAYSIISHRCPNQVCCSYNKENIYISARTHHNKYFKFDLDQKFMIAF